MEENGYATINFENEDITIVLPDGIKVIIQESQVDVEFNSFPNDLLAVKFTPDKCVLERNTENEEEQ